jgi:hypothetical protein
MQFRDFVFPHNPQSIIIRAGNRVVTYLCPGRGEASQNLGGENRVVTCKGAFFGRSYTEAASQLERFRSASAGERPGLLFIPGLPPMHVYLRELTVEASGDGQILPYTMIFAEGGV